MEAIRGLEHRQPFTTPSVTLTRAALPPVRLMYRICCM